MKLLKFTKKDAKKLDKLSKKCKTDKEFYKAIQFINLINHEKK